MLPSFFSQKCMLSMMAKSMDYLLGQLGSAVPAVCPFNSCATLPSSSLMGWSKEQKRLWLCSNTAQQWLKLLCIINSVSNTNLQNGHIPSTVKKTNSTSAKTAQKINKILKFTSPLFDLIHLCGALCISSKLSHY